MSLRPELAALLRPIADEVMRDLERDLAPPASAGKPPLPVVDGMRGFVEATARAALHVVGTNLRGRPIDADAVRVRTAQVCADAASALVRDVLATRPTTEGR